MLKVEITAEIAIFLRKISDKFLFLFHKFVDFGYIRSQIIIRTFIKSICYVYILILISYNSFLMT